LSIRRTGLRDLLKRELQLTVVARSRIAEQSLHFRLGEPLERRRLEHHRLATIVRELAAHVEIRQRKLMNQQQPPRLRAFRRDLLCSRRNEVTSITGASPCKIQPYHPTTEPGSLGDFARYFLGLGTFGFGGPIALAGYMQKDLVEQKRWITEAEYLDGIALARSSNKLPRLSRC
jgi:hypothetical protein